MNAHPGLRLRSILVLLAALLMQQGAGAANEDSLLFYRGQALVPGGSQLLYTEEHLLRGGLSAPRERLVLYRCADGTPFARKRVDYGPAALAPSFELRDARLGYREGLRREGEGLIAFAGDEASLREGRIELAANLVADSGFDRLVRERWTALQRGETVRIDFVVPARGRALGFRIRKIEALQVEGEPASRLQLALGGMLGLFAPAIEVVYRDADRWLLRFEGMTNIRAAGEKNVQARIEFPEPPSPQPDTRWQELEQLPLAACVI